MTPELLRILETLAEPARHAVIDAIDRLRAEIECLKRQRAAALDTIAAVERQRIEVLMEVECLRRARAEVESEPFALAAARLKCQRLERERDKLVAAAVSKWSEGRWSWSIGGRGDTGFPSDALAIAGLYRALGLEEPQP